MARVPLCAGCRDILDSERRQRCGYELWEGWYGGQILNGSADLFYTNLLFYPDGVSLIYHQHTVPHALLYQALRLLLPISSAYNLALNDQYIDLNSLAASKQIILRLQDPAQAESSLFKALDETLDRNHRLCGRATETSRTIAETFIASEFPCAILASEAQFSALYANGLKLENALLDHQASALDLYLYWKTRPIEDEIYAYSIQIVDPAGDKAQQADFVIGHEPLAYHRLDKSTLRPGDYVANLIVYGYNTGLRVSGTVGGSQDTFDWQLELTRFSIE